MQSNYLKTAGYLFFTLLALLSLNAFAHGVDDNTRAFLEQNTGVQFVPFVYIGAKHMITGYDHLLFLVGVIFFLYRSKDILLYVTLFTIGHSSTLLFGVLSDIQVNAYLIDAIIGFSVIYKGFDNLGGFKRCFHWQPNTQWVVLIFGLFHGFGLATKLQEFQLPEDGLITNLIAFNLGVELGQFAAFAIAAIVLVTFILPAEYNIDPTGIGQKLGLTRLANATTNKTDTAQAAKGSDVFQTIEVEVPAGRGIEFKFAMTQYSKMTYEWLTDGEALYFDLHGEPEGDTTGYFESYTIATSNEMKGSFTAPFAGSHGWYWKNKTNKPIAVQLLVKGQYQVIGLKQ